MGKKASKPVLELRMAVKTKAKHNRIARDTTTAASTKRRKLSTK